MMGMAAGEVLEAGFGVAWPLPDCEERFAACCACCIFLRRDERRDLAPSMTKGDNVSIISGVKKMATHA